MNVIVFKDMIEGEGLLYSESAPSGKNVRIKKGEGNLRKPDSVQMKEDLNVPILMNA